MSKNLLKLARELVEYADEAIVIRNSLESAPLDKKRYYQDQLKTILFSTQETLLSFSKELKESDLAERKTTETVKVRKKEIQDFVKTHAKKKKKGKESKIYKSNVFSKISNFFMEDFVFFLSKKYPEFTEQLAKDLTLANIRILSKSYISMMLFSTAISFPIITAIAFIALLKIWLALLIGIGSSVLTFFIFMKYPSYEKSTRSKLIRQEMVFALIHMSAVASSGATPIKIFKLLSDSKEYKHLQPEFERILNYINVFGYNLTTSLKAVASTSASSEFRELLYGLASTIETGGGIKEYLNSKADDALINYRLDQQKYLEIISTYSEIYTGILIAAPLLFIVTLAILERISPELGGVPIDKIALLSVFLAIPLLNILFILLLEGSRAEA
jgi:archaeal flagellar protein FlaJ